LVPFVFQSDAGKLKNMKKSAQNNWKRLCLIALLIILSSIPFLPGIKSPFFYDDINTIVMNPAIKAPKSYAQFFHQLESFSADRARMFRPLILISLALNWKYFQDNTTGWHLTNLIAHIISVILVFLLMTTLSGNWQLAFFSALLFGIHPSRVEPVLYISARSEIFASLFYLLAFWLFLQSQTQSEKIHELASGIFSILSFWLGLFSKDIAITLPAVLTIERFIFRKLNRKAIYWLFIFWANALLYFLLRRSLGLYTFFPVARPRPVFENFLLQARVILYYLRWLLFPAHNSVELKFSPVSPVWIALSIFILAGVLLSALLLLRKKPLVSFFLLFFFIVLSPSSSVVPLVVEGNLIRVYLAGLMVFVLIAQGFLFIKPRSLRISLLVIYFICLLSLSLSWSTDWRSPRMLWWETIKNFPSNSRAHNNLGIQMERSGNYAQAEREYESAVKTNPDNANALVNYARMLFAKEEFQRAEIYYKKAIILEPFNCPARINYSQLLLSTNRILEAKEILDEINFCPGYESELANQKKRINALLNSHP